MCFKACHHLDDANAKEDQMLFISTCTHIIIIIIYDYLLPCFSYHNMLPQRSLQIDKTHTKPKIQ